MTSKIMNNAFIAFVICNQLSKGTELFTSSDRKKLSNVITIVLDAAALN